MMQWKEGFMDFGHQWGLMLSVGSIRHAVRMPARVPSKRPPLRTRLKARGLLLRWFRTKKHKRFRAEYRIYRSKRVILRERLKKVYP